MFQQAILSVLLAYSAIQDAELKALENRRALRSGEIVVHCHFNRPHGPHGQHGPRVVDWDFHLWWDGDSLRQDETSRVSGKVETATRTSWYGENRCYWDAAYQNPQGITSAKIEPATNPGPVRINILALGVIPSDTVNLRNYSPDYFLANPDRASATEEAIELNGVACILVTIHRKNGAVVKYWLDPARGYNPVRCNGRWTSGSQKFDGTIDVKLAALADSGPWFPASYKYTRLVNGELAEEEEGNVEIISLNQPIPKEIFTFAGMGLPAGSHISDLTRPDVSESVAWDGSQIVAKARAERKVTAQYRTNLIYVVFAGMLAIVAAVLFWRFLSSRSTASH